jgi:hypothetical protein
VGRWEILDTQRNFIKFNVPQRSPVTYFLAKAKGSVVKLAGAVVATPGIDAKGAIVNERGKCD